MWIRSFSLRTDKYLDHGRVEKSGKDNIRQMLSLHITLCNSGLSALDASAMSSLMNELVLVQDLYDIRLFTEHLSLQYQS